MTPKQAQVLDTLKKLGHDPTVRSLADLMETRYHRAERWSDDEVRGLLDRLAADGHVSSYRGEKDEVRWKAVGAEDA